MIVMKFGGTSVESAAAITRVAGIVHAREARRPVVVVSAMGKTTNRLLEIAGAAIAGKREEYIRQLHNLRDYHSREARLIVPLSDRADLDHSIPSRVQTGGLEIEGSVFGHRWRFYPGIRGNLRFPLLRGAQRPVTR